MLRAQWNRAIEPTALPAYNIILVMVSFIAFALVSTEFSYAPQDLNGLAQIIATLALVGILARVLRFDRLGSCLEAIAIFSAISFAAPLCAVILASTNLPLVDDTLARIDRQIFFGFSRSAIASWVETQDWLFVATQWIYHSLMGQPFILFIMLYGSGRIERGSMLLFAWGATLLVTVAVSPLTPATGSPPYFLDFESTFHGARDGSLRVLGNDALTGIITFPSFHAAAAVLLAWGFSTFRLLGPVMVGFNALMWLSAIVAGHYLIDLIAGTAIAIAAIFLSKLIVSSFANPPRPSNNGWAKAAAERIPA